jgi:hypothetical protein
MFFFFMSVKVSTTRSKELRRKVSSFKAVHGHNRSTLWPARQGT